MLINLHSGNFVIHRGIMRGLLESIAVSALGGLKVITLDYRQAPLHRHPAATDDVQAVYVELLKQYRPEAIGVFGWSSGGVLAAQALARLQRRNLPRPGAVGIFNSAPPPCARALPRAAACGDSGIWHAGKPKNRSSELERVMEQTAHWYMEGSDIADPEAYPGRHDDVLAAFPPTLLLSGTRDPSLSISIAAHTRLLRLDVDASLYVMEGCSHATRVMPAQTPEAHDAQSYVAGWFNEHLAS